jgi:hypothetical protein
MQAHEQAEHARVIVGLEAFNLQVMLGLAIPCESQLVGQADVACDLIQEALIEVPPLTGHTGFNFRSAPDDAGLH